MAARLLRESTLRMCGLWCAQDVGPDGHVDITGRGVTEDVSRTRSGTLERPDSQVSAVTLLLNLQC